MKNKVFCLLCFISLLVACGGKQGPVITIFHTNDVQGFYWPRTHGENDNKPAGGFAVLKNMLSMQEAPYLLFDSGDSFSKTQEGQINKLEGAINLFNQLNYSAITLSAADLALGWDIVDSALAKATFPIVISNLKNKDGSVPKHIQPYIILNFNKAKIAVLGVVSKASFPLIQRNAGIQVQSEIDAIKEILPQVKQHKPDLIILLSSLGLEVESKNPNADEKALAEEFFDLTLILGGNGDLSAEGIEEISTTIITRSETMLREIDKITLQLNTENQLASYRYEPVILSVQAYGEDAQIKAEIDAMTAFVKRRTSYKIAQVQEELETYANAPSPLGEYTAQCIKSWGRTEVGLINSDAFLANLQTGPVTDVSLHSIIPFNDRVMFLKMRGDELKNAIEHTLDLKINWPQMAGVSISYDKQAPLGKKIKSLTVNGQAMRDAQVYSITATDHIVAGGFGHNEFLNVYEFKNTDRTLRDITRWCLSRQKNIKAVKPIAWKAI